MKEGLFTETQRHALRALIQLTAGRASEEAAVDEAFRSGTEHATHEYQSQRDEIEQRYKAEKQQTDRNRRMQASDLKQAFEVEHEQLKRAYESELSTINEKADRSEVEARKQLEEAVWAADTVFEATEDQPQEDYEHDCRVLEAKRDELHDIVQDADEYLKRCRIDVARSDGDHPQGTADVDACLAESRRWLDLIRSSRLPRAFKGIRPILIASVLTAATGLLLAWNAGWSLTSSVIGGTGGALAGSIVLLVLLRILARRRIASHRGKLQDAVALGLQAHDQGLEDAAADRDRKQAERIAARDRDIRETHEKYQPILDEIQSRRDHHLGRINAKYPGLIQECEDRYQRDSDELESTHRIDLAQINQAYTRSSTELREQNSAAQNEARAAYDARWNALEHVWKSGMANVCSTLEEIHHHDRLLNPSFDDDFWNDFTPTTAFAPAVRFGTLGIDVDSIPGGLPADERLAVPIAPTFTLPAVLAFPDRCSMLIEADGDHAERAIATLRTVMFRLLTTLPPGKVRFTIFDPVGLGQSFAGFMHLTDYLEALVTDKIWTEARHIEQKLVDLTDHMENVIQKYLRNEYETISEYNEHAGEIAEPYRFLVIANLPAGMTETAARRLASVLSSGARCGVYTLLHLDAHASLPKGLSRDDLLRNSVHLTVDENTFVWNDDDYRPFPLALESPPSDALLTRVMHAVGAGAKDSSRVEVPFDVVAPKSDELWTADCTDQLSVTLGRAGATKLQAMELGRGTSQHVLIAGKTGSGKSTLLHVLVANLASWYSPDQVQMYLVDFKKGVEFKTYATHKVPHVRAVAIESDREFGLSVLQRLDDELKQRGELFRNTGVQDLPGYRRARPNDAMPRTLLIIDEFQEFFVEDDKIAQDASLLLDRLIRQGRAFGMHVILGSQTLGGAYSLAKSTLGQMAVRIALQCSENDAYLIMNDDNSAARLLARPGEAIYNDASGMVEGNSPFQVVWLADERRDRALQQVSRLAEERNYQTDVPQIVFEGNAPAELPRNHLLARFAEMKERPNPLAVRAWLGDAVSIKDPTAAVFRRQTGSNLILVGQRDESALSMLIASTIGIAAQHDAENASFVLLDGTPADAATSGMLASLGELLPHRHRTVGWRDVTPIMSELVQTIEDRQNSETDHQPPAVYLIIHGLQRFRDLRQSDDFGFSMDDDKPPSADKLFQTILRDGPMVGVHSIIWCDTMTNVERTLDRQSMREFEMRVAFQMSATDSSNLIDNPQASRLGLYHALFLNEEQGVSEKFRPYALPPREWIESTTLRMRGDTMPQLPASESPTMSEQDNE